MEKHQVIIVSVLIINKENTMNESQIEEMERKLQEMQEQLKARG